jgi:hypothetical protein
MSAQQPVPRGMYSKNRVVSQGSDVGRKTWFLKKETTFPAAANAAMRLALRTANFCMERNAREEKEDGKCSQLEDGKVERCTSTTDFPDYQS